MSRKPSPPQAAKPPRRERAATVDQMAAMEFAAVALSPPPKEQRLAGFHHAQIADSLAETLLGLSKEQLIERLKLGTDDAMEATFTAITSIIAWHKTQAEFLGLVQVRLMVALSAIAQERGIEL